MRSLVAVIALALIAAAPAAAKPGPKARFTASPRSPQAGQRVKLTAGKCKRCRYRWHVLRGGKARVLGKGRGRVLRYRFRTAGVKRVRLTVIDRRGRKHRRTKRLRVRPAAMAPAPPQVVAPPPPVGPPPVSPLPPLGQPSCVPGATPAASPDAVRAAIAAGQDACVTTPIGDVDLDDLSSAAVRTVGTQAGGSIGAIHVQGASGITIRARFRSAIIDSSDRITVEQSQIGGTPSERILDVLLLVRERGDDITIRDNDLGWTTTPDVSGSEGYGIRAFNDLNRLRIERNYIHHIGADAIQLSLDGADTIIDRNEVAYAARSASSDEHSDDLQIVSHGPNLQVTNNYFHHCGWWTASGPTTGCNSMALHAGTSNSLVFENNVEAHALGLPFIGDLGTGGTERSNATFRRNTWWDNGTQFADKPDLQWGLKSGSNNRWERNLVVSKLNFSGGAGFAQSGTATSANLVGGYAMNAFGECTAAACNPGGAEPIGYRKPVGVHW
jgi:hypothetical protein